MTVPASAETMLVDQIFYLHRKAIENNNDPTTLWLIHHFSLLYISYITGKKISDDKELQKLLPTAPTIDNVKILRQDLIKVNEILMVLLRDWMETKRAQALMASY